MVRPSGRRCRTSRFSIRTIRFPDHDLSFVKNRVGKIAGTLTVEGTSLTTTEVLFNDGGFTVDGGIVFRNCAQLFNLNGMKSMTAVGGDLVFENCPKIATNWGAGAASRR